MRNILFLLFYTGYHLIQAQLLEVTKSLGIDHKVSTPLFIGGGAAFLDYNGDGWEDLYLVGAENGNKLYHNDGLKYIDISDFSQIAFHTENRYTSGVISGDINRDGCEDIFVTTMDNGSNILMMGRCDGKFFNETRNWGIENDKVRSSAAAFLDFNNDGYLDLYVVNYVKESLYTYDSAGDISGFAHEPQADFLYKNVDGKRFEKIELNDTSGTGLVVMTVDTDKDKDLDILVVNDFGEWVVPNQALVAENGGFSDKASELGFDIGVYGMGIAHTDFNQDGIPDYYVTNIGPNKFLVSNIETGKYEDRAFDFNIAASNTVDNRFSSGWGCTFFDLENDGDDDLFVANGYIPVADFLGNDQFDSNKLFVLDDNTYVDATIDQDVGRTDLSRAAITGDFDRDGRLDLFISNLVHSSHPDTYSVLYQNKNEAGNYLSLSLLGTESNPNAIGATVEIRYDNRHLKKQVISGGSFASQNSRVLHFGLATYSQVERLTVHWPSGLEQSFSNVAVNHKYRLKEGETLAIAGCKDAQDSFFDADATFDEACYTNIIGCTDPFAVNFNPDALVDNGSCYREGDRITSVEKTNSIPVQVYPTIFNNELFLKKKTDEAISYFLYNFDGRKILSGVLIDDLSIIDTSGINEGKYLVRFYNQKVESGFSIIVKH